MDLDATIKAQILNKAEVTTIMDDVLSVPIDDDLFLLLRT